MTLGLILYCLRLHPGRDFFQKCGWVEKFESHKESCRQIPHFGAFPVILQARWSQSSASVSSSVRRAQTHTFWADSFVRRAQTNTLCVDSSFYLCPCLETWEFVIVPRLVPRECLERHITQLKVTFLSSQNKKSVPERRLSIKLPQAWRLTQGL